MEEAYLKKGSAGETLSLSVGGADVGYLLALPDFKMGSRYTSSVMSSLVKNYMEVGTAVVDGVSSVMPESTKKTGENIRKIVTSSVGIAQNLLTMYGVSTFSHGLATRQYWDGGGSSYWEAHLSTRMTPSQFLNFYNSDLFQKAVFPNSISTETISKLIQGVMTSVLGGNIPSGMLDADGNLKNETGIGAMLTATANSVDAAVNQGTAMIGGGGVSIETLSEDLYKAGNVVSKEEKEARIKKFMQNKFGSTYEEAQKEEAPDVGDAVTGGFTDQLGEYGKAKAQVALTDAAIKMDNAMSQITEKLGSMVGSVVNKTSVGTPLNINSNSIVIRYGTLDVTDRFLPTLRATSAGDSAIYSNGNRVVVESITINPSETLSVGMVPQWFDIGLNLSSTMVPVKEMVAMARGKV